MSMTDRGGPPDSSAEALLESDSSLLHDLFTLTAAVDAAPDGVAILDREGAIQHANSAFQSIAEMGMDELRAQPAWDLPSLRLDTRTRQAIAAAVQEGEPLLVDVLPTDEETSGRWREVRLTPVTGPRGDPSHFVWIHREADLQMRVQLELTRQARRGREVASLLESHLSLDSFDEFLQRVVEGVADVLGAQFCEILWPGERSTSLRIRAHVGWARETVDRVIVRPAQASQSGYTLLTGKPEVLTGADEGPRFFQPEIHKRHDVRAGVTVPLLDDGVAVGVLGAHFDAPRTFERGDVQFLETTARIVMAAWHRTQATEEIQEQRDQLRTIFEESAEGIYLARVLPAGGFAYELSNPALSAITGLEVRGPKPLDEEGSEADRRAAEDFQTVVDTGLPLHTEQSFDLPVGRRRLSISRTPVFGPDGRVQRIVGMVVDVTAEHEIQERLELANRMEALGRLAGGMAHELNNVLTSILGNIALIGSRLGGSGIVDEELDDMVRDARKAAELVAQILKFARVQPALPTLFDLNSVLDRFHAALPQMLGEGVSVDVQRAPESMVARADQGAVEQVLANIAENAREAMPRGGSFTVRASPVELSSEAAGRLGLGPGPYGLLSIRDTGTGMEEATRRRVFEPFFTTKAQGEGHGLGMASAYGTVRPFGGTMQVQSAPGLGTTIDIYLPRLPSPAPPDATPVAGTVTVRGTETILLVEDEDSVRKITGRLLGKLGYTVLNAPNADETLRLFATRSATIDLVLTDVVMPGLSGIELAERLQARYGSVKILFTSGYASKELGRTPEAPPEPFLPKPFTMDELAERVRGVLDS